MYDWANSAFATTVMAAVLPIFFRNVSTAAIPQSHHYLATSLWGYTASAAMLFIAIIALIMGPIADHFSSKKIFIGIFTSIGVLFTALISLTGSGDWIWVSIFFIAANIGFAGSEIFYDSLLPHISRPEHMDRVSTRGYATGYFGGGLLLIINIIMIWLLPKTSIQGSSVMLPILGMRLSILSAAVWWGLFSLFLFKIIPEPKIEFHDSISTNPLKISAGRLINTFKEIKRYKNLFLFLLAFWFYNDGIGTIIKMATAFGDEIGISTMDLVGALLLTQIVGFPSSLGFGKIAERIGAKKTILIGLAIYIMVSVAAFFITRAIHFWIVAFIIGLIQGGTQALSRSLFGSMVPRKKSAEFFGFYNISGKFAGIIGPAIFGIVSQLAKTSRLGVLSLILFFVTGGLLLLKVDTEKSNTSRNQTIL